MSAQIDNLKTYGKSSFPQPHDKPCANSILDLDNSEQLNPLLNIARGGGGDGEQQRA